MRINVILMDGAPTPRHAKAGDAGLDLTTRQTVEIGPHETVKVKTGVRMEIPQGYFGLVAPRSSVAANRGITLANTPSVIDSGFRGEILLPLHNLCDNPMTVERGERVAQIIIMRHETCECVAVSELSETERGEGGVGSTGRF